MRVITVILTFILCTYAVGTFCEEALIWRGYRLLESKQPVQAYSTFVLASYCNPFDPMPHYFAGNVLGMMRDYRGALMHYKQVRKRSPDFLLTNVLYQKAKEDIKNELVQKRVN